MRIRPFSPGEERQLHAVFYSAVHSLASRDYSPEQLDAWAPTDPDDHLNLQWASRIQAISPFVVEVDSAIVAYADLQPSGYIDHFFVSAPYSRRGIGSSLMTFLLSEATAKHIPVLTSDVSLTAQPFFQHFGFHLVEHRAATIRGVKLPNALMQRSSVA